MAYEYESDIPEFLKGIEFEHPLDLTKEIKEVQEVYRKAKAWDNYIAEVRERVRFTENTEDDIEKETQKVIDYYMEDNNND